MGNKGIGISGDQVAGHQGSRISGYQDRRRMREEEEYRISNKEFQMSKVGILLKKAEKGGDEGGREQQNIE